MNTLLSRILPLIGSLGLFALIALYGQRALPGQSPAAPDVALQVLTPQVPQGGVILGLIDALGATAVRLREGDRTAPALQRPDGRWEVSLGVWMEEAPGARPLTAEADGPWGTTTATAAVTVTKRAFPIQRLRMSKSQDALYDDPAVEEEYRLITAAIRRESPRRRWQGDFRLPAPGRVSTRYGTQRYRNGKKVGIHKGIDIAAPAGTPVIAAADGVVALRGDFRLHGRTLVVDHGGGVTGLYIHLREFGVSEGQRVTAGQKIARVGSTGVATGPHLHYALYVHGVAVDPLLWRQTPAAWRGD